MSLLFELVLFFSLLFKILFVFNILLVFIGFLLFLIIISYDSCNTVFELYLAFIPSILTAFVLVLK
jgi:hypothetical protein